jgi:hypothetical protein
MCEEKTQVRCLDINQFFASSQKMPIGEDVRAEMRQEQDEGVLDADQIRYQEDWSSLATKIVGAEGDEP